MHNTMSAQYPDMDKSLQMQDIEDVRMNNDGEDLLIVGGVPINRFTWNGLLNMRNDDGDTKQTTNTKECDHQHAAFSMPVPWETRQVVPDTHDMDRRSVSPSSLHTPPCSLQGDNSQDETACNTEFMHIHDCSSPMDRFDYHQGGVSSACGHYSRSMDNVNDFMSSGYNSVSAMATPGMVASPAPSLNASMDIEYTRHGAMTGWDRMYENGEQGGCNSNLFRARMSGATGSSHELGAHHGNWANWNRSQIYRKPCALRPSLDRIDSVSNQMPAPVNFSQLASQPRSTFSDVQHQPNDHIDEDRELAEMAAMLTKPRRRPVNYECDICHARDDHLITDCPMKDDSKAQTPYQGNKVCYGEFTCPKCKRNWRSGKSRANTAQQCSKCRIDVMPKKQLNLEKARSKGLLTDDGDRTCSSLHSANTSRCASVLSNH